MAPFRIAKPRFLLYFALEGALIFALLVGLAYLTSALDASGEPSPGRMALPAGLLFTAVLLATQWTNPGDQASIVREVVLFGFLSLAAGILCFAAIWVVASRPDHPAGLLVLEGAVAVPAIVGLWRWLSLRFDVLNVTRESVLIVGTGESARQVCRWILSHHAAEYAVVGFADEDDSHLGTVLAMGVRIQTDYESLTRFAPGRADRVIVALDEKRGRLPVRQLMGLRLIGLEIEEAPTFFERIGGKIPVEAMLPSWLIYSEGFKSSALRAMLKRSVDVVLAGLLLLLAAPLMLVIAALVRLTSRGPVLYRQTRLGMNGREFDVLKFRSMIHDAEAASGPTWTEEFDRRITVAGRILRPSRFDELPQLVNVLRGEMSFVGPRPEREHFVVQLEETIPYYGLRMAVRPGITGWAQVNYRYGASEEDALEKLKYDLYYIKNNNLALDLWIVLKTFKVVLFGAGAR